ncbi:MAG: nucleotidyl transferase AbiEii/AbiGii toxin family protein [Dissulfuribacterales bacterium]
MFEEVLSADAIKAVKSLAPRVGDFYLAGGTALALQLRHRKSDDLDFFSTRPFNTDVLLATIQATRVFFTSQGTIHCEVEGIRVSFLYYEVPLIAAPAVWRGIKVAHWRDIGAEKIKTISQRGAKKDFCDLYAIIKLRASIREVCSVFNPNYAAAKFAKDARRKARRRTFVLQVPDNKADLVKLAAPCGFKYRTIFNSGGMHLLGEHSKLDNTP